MLGCWLERTCNKTDVDFPLHVFPFFCRAKDSHKLLKHFFIIRCILKPGQEVKRLSKIITVVQPTCNFLHVSQPNSDMVRTLLKNHAPFILGQLPPGHRLLDRDECSMSSVCTAQWRLLSN